MIFNLVWLRRYDGVLGILIVSITTHAMIKWLFNLGFICIRLFICFILVLNRPLMAFLNRIIVSRWDC